MSDTGCHNGEVQFGITMWRRPYSESILAIGAAIQLINELPGANIGMIRDDNGSCSGCSGYDSDDDDPHQVGSLCAYECPGCQQPCQEVNNGLMHECECGALHLSEPPGLTEFLEQARADGLLEPEVGYDEFEAEAVHGWHGDGRASREASRGSNPVDICSPVGKRGNIQTVGLHFCFWFLALYKGCTHEAIHTYHCDTGA